MGTPYFKVPLNLPHAGKIAGRLRYHVDRRLTVVQVDSVNLDPLFDGLDALIELLEPCLVAEENPSDEAEARALAEQSAKLGRELVAEIERLKLGDDRLGQAVRNFFECLELGEEGARISLRAGENPNSALRPV